MSAPAIVSEQETVSWPVADMLANDISLYGNMILIVFSEEREYLIGRISVRVPRTEVSGLEVLEQDSNETRQAWQSTRYTAAHK